MTTCSKLEYIIKHGESALRPQKRRSNLALSYKSSSVHYEPLGVVTAIVSWNYRTLPLLRTISDGLGVDPPGYPYTALHNLISPLVAAIFSGNGCVIKCSEYVYWSSRFYIGAFRECLFACGWNPELVQVRPSLHSHLFSIIY